MGRKLFITGTLAALLGLFCLGGIAAAVDVPTEPLAISVDGQTRPLIVKFNHETHKSAKCVDCHHAYKPDDKGEYGKDKRGNYKKLPENMWKEGDPVKKCSECHVLEADKKKKKEMLSDPKQIRSMEDAFHDNCVACHKEINKTEKRKGDDKLPQTCNDCHEKAK